MKDGKFEVGDRVRVKHERIHDVNAGHAPVNHVYSGAVYVVIEANRKATIRGAYDVKLDRGTLCDNDDLELAYTDAPTTTDDAVDVKRIVIAEIAEWRFERDGDEIVVFNDDEAYGSFSLAQWRKINEIIDGAKEAK